MGRRLGAWMVAAAVTAALVAGGVLVARDRAEGPPAVLPALDLDAAGQAAVASAASEPAPAPAAKDQAGRPYVPGDLGRRWPPTTYRLRGPLPALPERATAWKVGDSPDPDRLAALAAALGLAGQPRQDPAGWTVRGSRRSLMVYRLAGAPFAYGSGLFGACARLGGGPYRPRGGIQCVDPDAPVTGRAAAGGSVAPANPLPRPALPSRAEAERVARDLAARAGLDLAGARVRVDDGWAARTVSIAPAVGGLPTAGFAWSVAVGAKGVVQYASGWLATPEPADTYPLVGVAEGFERLKKAPPPPSVDLAAAASPVARIPCPAATPDAKVPCAVRPLPARVATVTGVRLGLKLAPARAVNGQPSFAYLLPAYLFDLEGDWADTRAVVAVPDRYLTR